jgi:hypothetical protein
MGQKLDRFGELRGTRSHQDEPMEVGEEVGSERPSSGFERGATSRLTVSAGSGPRSWNQWKVPVSRDWLALWAGTG